MEPEKTHGNKGRKLSPETREKMRLARLGKLPSNTGKSPSEETRKKMSEAKMGKVTWNTGRMASDETKAKMSVKRIGKKLPPLSEEAKRKISESQKRRHAERKQLEQSSTSLGISNETTPDRNLLHQEPS